MITKLSIIIPVFNEEKYLLKLLRQIQFQRIPDYELEIIVVDDGSTDDSVKLLKENPDLYTLFIQNPENLGKGGAVISGLLKATGDYVLFQDADLEYDPQDYKKMIEPVTLHDADCVIGSRFLSPELNKNPDFVHKMGNVFISFVFNVCNKTAFTDIYSCYLLFRRSLINPQELETKGWEQQAELLSKIVKKGSKLYEVPISYNGRSVEDGKKIRYYHVVSVLRAILRF